MRRSSRNKITADSLLRELFVDGLGVAADRLVLYKGTTCFGSGWGISVINDKLRAFERSIRRDQRARDAKKKARAKR